MMKTMKTKCTIASNKTHPIFGCVLYLILPSLLLLFLDNATVSICIIDFAFYFFVLFYRRKHSRPYPGAIFSNDIKVYATSCVCFLLMGSYLWTRWYLSFVSDPSTENYITDISGTSVLLYLFMTCIAAPVGEESLFRYLCINGFSYSLKNRSVLDRIVWSVLFSSLLFAVMHGTGVHIVSGMLCGMSFGLIYALTNRLSLSIGIHSLYNIGTLLFDVPCSFILCLVFVSIGMFLFFLCISKMSQSFES